MSHHEILCVIYSVKMGVHLCNSRVKPCQTVQVVEVLMSLLLCIVFRLVDIQVHVHLLQLLLVASIALCSMWLVYYLLVVNEMCLMLSVSQLKSWMNSINLFKSV